MRAPSLVAPQLTSLGLIRQAPGWAARSARATEPREAPWEAAVPVGPAIVFGGTGHPGRGMGVQCTRGGSASGRPWLIHSVCNHLPDEELYVPSTGARLLWWRINGNFSLGVKGVERSYPEWRCLSQP